ncbi:hypothetical protein ACFX16_013203 [Malus domestica]
MMPILDDEIKDAARQLGGLKAPGPDGFSGVFYHSFWDKICTEVTELVRFFMTGENAFVRGRQIQDNLGIVHELFHFLKLQKAKCKFELGLKLNMQKAYNLVECDFLDAVIAKIGFHLGVMMSAHGPSISHLFFADDTLIVFKADMKLCVFFSANTPRALATELGNVLDILLVSDPGSYLGIPALWGQSKCSGLAYVKGRLLGKLQGWKRCTLSPTGREVLGLPKKDGGLGFRNFRTFNDALLAKQCRRLISEPHSLWASILKAQYFPHCSFLNVQRGSRTSWAWTSLLVGRDVLLKGAHWQIMDRKIVRLWVDKWLPSLLSGHSIHVVVWRPSRGHETMLLYDRLSTWFPHSEPYLKVNVDASWSARTCSGFVGIVIRDMAGSFVATRRHAIRAPSVGAAEAVEILKRCEFGLAMGLTGVFSGLSLVLDSTISQHGGGLLGITAVCRDVRGFLVNKPPSSLVFVLHNDGLPCPP